VPLNAPVNEGYTLEPDGYSCTKLNYSKLDSAVLYEKEASFVAVLDEEDSGYGPGSTFRGGEEVIGPHASPYTSDRDYNQLIDRADILNYDRYKTEHMFGGREGGGEEEETGPEAYLELEEEVEMEEEEEEEEGGGREGAHTSPGPNLEQKVPSPLPDLMATQSLTSLCQVECGGGRCEVEGQSGVPRCLCPLGRGGRYCHTSVQIETARFHGMSWVGFAPLKEAYRDVQLTLEFKPDSPDGVLLVSGENDDLSGDFMAAVLVGSYVEFRWDCGSGSGSVKSPEGVNLGEWNRVTVYRHRWDVWLQLNDGHHIQGRSQGLFSRITFREPLYVGGSNNLTSLGPRLGVRVGLQGCVRRLQVNDHVYRFRKSDPVSEPNLSADYASLDGFGITECIGDACSEVECQHGGKCVASTQDDRRSNLTFPTTTTTPTPPPFFPPPPPEPVCLCPLGYSGEFCEKQLNLEVPSFNGSSHLVFPALGGSVLSWLELEVVFRPAATDGIILYEGHRSDGTGDFIALTLYQAHVLFTIDLGSGILTLRSIQPIRPGTWHVAKVSRTGRLTHLYVDQQPAVSGLTPGAFTMLSLSHPLYLGGIPPSSSSPHPALTPPHAFMGCVQKLSLNGRPIHLVSGAVSGSNVGSCDHPCTQRPCDNGGICEPHGPSYTCRCPLGFKDEHCQSRIVTQAAIPSFGGRSFLKYSGNDIMKRVSGDKLHLWLRFRSLAPYGLLIWAGEEEMDEGSAQADILLPPPGDTLSLMLQDGRLVLRYNLGSGFAQLTYNSSRLDDGQWHTVRIYRYEREARMSVDEGEENIVVSPGDLVQLNLDSALYVGGRMTVGGVHLTPGLTGCLADLTLATDYHLDLITQAVAGQNIDYC
ncbi:hypothetical protein Pcinc_036911, partial [Petrolisthes cinctipes]